MNKSIINSIMLCAAYALGIANANAANEHLIPDESVMAGQNSYENKLETFFQEGRDDRSALRSWIIPSFSEEEMILARKGESNYEIVSVQPSTPIQNMERLDEYKAGLIVKLDSKGTIIPFNDDPEYLELKKSTPGDIREMKSVIRRREIPEEIYERMSFIWKDALLGVKRENPPQMALDGNTYTFAAFIDDYGVITGRMYSPDSGTKMAALAELLNAMSNFSNGEAEVDKVRQALDKYDVFVRAQ